MPRPQTHDARRSQLLAAALRLLVERPIAHLKPRVLAAPPLLICTSARSPRIPLMLQ